MATVEDMNISEALEDANARYIARNPESYEAHKQACDYLPGGNTRSVLHARPFPLTFTSGHGSKLASLDGDTYTDFLGEYSAGIFGHSNSRIAEAVASAMKTGWNMGGMTQHERDLAKRVCQRFGLERVRFTNSGTEANTMALAAAVAYAQHKTKCLTKNKILVCSNAYHGGTLSFPMRLIQAIRLRDSGKEVQESRPGEDSFVSSLSTNLPHEFVFAPFNDVEETIAIVEALRDSSLTVESHLAAIIVEPVQGAGGCRPASKEFLKCLRQLADAHSALFIADEVMTSRLAPAGLCREWGIQPDLVTLGKWIGGGMSFGAFGGDSRVMELFNPDTGILSHAGTFNNNVLSMAAGNVGLEICSPERLRELSALGTSLKEGIRGVLAKHGLQGDHYEENDGGDLIETDTFDEGRAEDEGVDQRKKPRMFVTGYGSLVNVRFRGRDANICQSLFFHHMVGLNIYLSARGYMALSLELTQHDVTNFLDAVDKFVIRYSHLLKISDRK